MLPGKKFTIADILAILRRRLRLILILPVVAVFIALVYSSTIPNLYQSDMLIAIDPQRVPDSFVRSTVTLETDRRMDALIVQVLSRRVLQGLIEKFDLYPEERKLLPLEDVLTKMREAIAVPQEFPRPRWGQVPQPTAFHVRFTYPEPNLAARVAQEIGGVFVEQNTRERGALAGATNRFLETQLVESRQKLEAQEQKLEAFRQKYGKELPTQMQANMSALTNSRLQAQSLVESTARDRDRKMILERLYREAAAEPPPTVANPAGPATSAPTASMSAEQQLAAARSTLAGLKLRYRPDHPDVLRGERLVAELEPKAAAEQAQLRASSNSQNATPTIVVADPARRESLRQMRTEMETLDRQIVFKESEEGRVRADIAEYQRRIEAVPGLESEFAALTRDYDTQQQGYKDLLQKSTAARMAANLEEQDIGETFRVVDPAVVPVRPVPSIRGRINAIGLAIGLVLGFGIAALLELRDSSFRTDGEILEILALPVLAAVPRVETAASKLAKRRRRLFISLAGATSVVIAGYVTWTLKLWNSVI